jgi:uncharacterized repeat protein (TIGR03803 family)
MARVLQRSSKYFVGCALAFTLFTPFSGAIAKSGFAVLYTFCSQPNCTDGGYPKSALIKDKAGNLYGTTSGGGVYGSYGTVFKLAPDGTETVLHAFAGADGAGPDAGLLMDKAGDLYSTTSEGGGAGCYGGNGCGIVFELAPDGTETVLHAFTGADGANPYAGVIRDKAGNLYGTTWEGGACDEQYGCGTAFKLSTDGIETVLYEFTDGNDGGYPFGGLIKDKEGNLFGTTESGGSGTGCPGSVGCGTVFKLARNGAETVLYAFNGGSDGLEPLAGLIMDKAGNLFGTTAYGGGTGCGGAGCGTVFKLAPNGAESVLHAFVGSDGANPFAGLIMDEKGNLYGTTYSGGAAGDGTVFKLKPDGTETVLHFFAGWDGAVPGAALLMDKKGNLYGTTEYGGTNDVGIVFELKK